MSLFRQWFQKPEPIASIEALEDFLDANAAFVAQRFLFEYARALAGYAWQPLMGEEGFKAAMERSRWLAYPLAMALVAELVEGVLRFAAKGRMPELPRAIDAAAQAALARHTPPASIEAATWELARARLSLHIGALQATPPLAIKDIAKPFAEEMLGLLPIHPRLGGRDPYVARNNLAVGLLKVHEDFLARADQPALIRALLPPADRDADGIPA